MSTPLFVAAVVAGLLLAVGAAGAVVAWAVSARGKRSTVGRVLGAWSLRCVEARWVAYALFNTGLVLDLLNGNIVPCAFKDGSCILFAIEKYTEYI